MKITESIIVKRTFIIILSIIFACSSIYLHSQELIVNGSFDNDMDGFYTEYYFVKDPPMIRNAAYTITNDPGRYLSGWASLSDKSPSTNNKMFLADAGSNTKQVFLGTNVKVKTNSEYLVTCWAARVNNASPPIIKIDINGKTQIIDTIDVKAAVWVKMEFVWNSEQSDSARIKLFDLNPSLYGNDFVIDEISMKEIINIKNKIKVKFADENAYPGDLINLKILLDSSGAFDILKISDSFKAKVNFNQKILLQHDTSIITNNDHQFLEIEGKTGTTALITEIPVIVGLGNNDFSLLNIDNFELFDKYGNLIDIDIIKQSGIFKLLGICYEGGKRLINPDGISNIAIINNQKTDEMLQLHITLKENNNKLIIYSTNGSQIFSKTYNFTGEINEFINISKLSSGIYFVQLKTPTEIINQKFIIY